MAPALAVGDPAPDFTLPSTQGPVTLSKLLTTGAVLLVFYPGDDTPVCTKQLCNYRDNLSVFEGLGVQVVAINPQSASSHEKFAAKHALPFPVVADETGETTAKYGARGLLGMTKRALVLVGRDGRVKWQHTDFPIFHSTADDIRKAVAALPL